jgi:membrane protein required for colicin V production
MGLQEFNWIDYSIIGIILFSTLISIVRGFVREALSLIIWGAAFVIAYKFGSAFGIKFLSMIESETIQQIVGFVAVFFIALIVGAIANYFIGSLVYGTGLGGTDRVIGLAFGLVRGVLLVGVLLLSAALTNVNQSPAWAQSKVLPQFTGLVNWLYGILPEKIEALIEVAQKEAAEKFGIPDGILTDMQPEIKQAVEQTQITAATETIETTDTAETTQTEEPTEMDEPKEAQVPNIAQPTVSESVRKLREQQMGISSNHLSTDQRMR